MRVRASDCAAPKELCGQSQDNSKCQTRNEDHRLWELRDIKDAGEKDTELQKADPANRGHSSSGGQAPLALGFREAQSSPRLFLVN